MYTHGTIDYEKGEIITNPIKIISSEKNDGNTPIIEISAIPESNDILGVQDLYLQIDTALNTPGSTHNPGISLLQSYT